MTTDIRLDIPSVDRLARLASVEALIAEHGRELVMQSIRATLQGYRELAALPESAAFNEFRFVCECEERLREHTRSSLQPVFNLTGTVLHTNLGRALLPAVAVQAAAQAMTRPMNLEFDLSSGGRGERDEHVGDILCRLTGAESATVVNNNAAAVLLVLNTLALRKEVIVSRGELVEIGGGFRIPAVMSRAGCRLREVGTTNRTHARDYAEAIGQRTAAIMKVHTSNYAIQGFTASVAEGELAGLAHERSLPFLVDLGSGALIDLDELGLAHESTPRETIEAGADLVMFSGDKLLGGPQCGLIVGRRDLIDKVRANPLKRALRVDKVILAALEAVLRLYMNPKQLITDLPTLRMIRRPSDEIEASAHRILPAVATAVGPAVVATVEPCMSQIGSGSLPVDLLPSSGIALKPIGRRARSAVEALSAAFRALPTPVIGRMRNGTLMLDLRCLDDEAAFIAQLPQLVSGAVNA